MERQIYRQAALDRLSSPERLDEPYSIVSSRTWLMLLTIIAIAVFGIGWALVSKAPVKVKAQGILLQEQGLKDVVASEPGRVSSIEVKVGDRVEAGMVIAQFKRSDTVREAELVAAEIIDLQTRIQALEKFYGEESQREIASDRERVDGLRETLELTERRRALLEKRVNDLERLVQRKIIVQTRLITAELEISDTSEKISRLQNEIRAIESATAERLHRQRLSLLDEQIKLEQRKRQLVRLNAQLDERRVVTSTEPGRVVEMKINPGDVVSAGQSLVTLAPLIEDDQRSIAVVYVAAVDGKRVRPGMEAEIVPSLFKRAQYGFIRGEVTAVSDVPATQEGMLRVLRNPQLASELSGGASAFEVRIRMFPDPATDSGLKWSSSTGPPTEINPGTLIGVEVVVDRKPIADLVVPGLSRQLGLSHDG